MNIYLLFTVRFERPNASALVPGAAKDGAALPGKDQALVAAKGGGEAELVRDPAGKFTDEEIYEVNILSIIIFIHSFIHSLYSLFISNNCLFFFSLS